MRINVPVTCTNLLEVTTGIDESLMVLLVFIDDSWIATATVNGYTALNNGVCESTVYGSLLQLLVILRQFTAQLNLLTSIYTALFMTIRTPLMQQTSTGFVICLAHMILPRVLVLALR